jgi:hypothetical protein
MVVADHPGNCIVANPKSNSHSEKLEVSGNVKANAFLASSERD